MNEFDALMHHLMTLETLTEQKIDAATSRDTSRLVQLLQEELDPLNYINQHLLDLATLSQAQRQIIGQHAMRWQERTQFLHDVLQTQLGYCDFVRMLMGDTRAQALNMDL
ncbi:MAG: hypothetical protein C7B47_04315 [Sulfobacillus thermosulfidooxidans]|uniref:FlgN protein n=1 Tax=Sulfobacillus thermosulfidooxidans TaxID=28034 RepID=A0A2T2X1M7_SULTH|nr:MAG: hypothetical protein C7B47_04315 [Sulfobacillus thermosulfidooxidans]